MQVNENPHRDCLAERMEKVEAALAKLQSLKKQVAALRLQCEALKKRRSENQIEVLVCNECGKLINQGQEVTLKDSLGEVKSHYHKECFKRIWLSQTWVFDYSIPGFLRPSGKSK
jgi:hypothetical protein